MLSPRAASMPSAGATHQWAFSSGAGAMDHGEEEHAQRPPMWLSQQNRYSTRHGSSFRDQVDIDGRRQGNPALRNLRRM